MSSPEVTPVTPSPPLDTAFAVPPPPDAIIATVSPPTPSTAGSPPPADNTAVAAVSPPPSGLSGPTLTALGVGASLGGLIVLIAVGFFVLIYRRRKRKELELLPTKNDQAGLPPQQWSPHAPANNTGSQYPKPALSPGSGEKHQSPTGLPSTFLPFSSTSDSVSVGSEKPFSSESMSSYNSTFSYDELARATNNFSGDNILGQGGFGYVHKGILPNGKEVAVKALKAGSGQGEREFQAEVETISRVHHRHLVSLVGYCMSGEKRLLVYEFVPNQTLEAHLHGEGRPTMNWQLRLKIAVGAAKGLAYLHEDCNPKIIHRDIKASNILIDNHFEAKVADFGLAKFSYDNDTHVSTRVMGTFGYLAPEYAASGKLTEKSDVFSFGIVLLELITGRRPIDKAQAFLDDSMVEWARPLLRRALEDGIFEGLADPKLEEYNAAELSQMMACAEVCVRQSARRRPYMSQVVRALEGNLTIDELYKEKSPGGSTVFGSSDYDHSQQYREDLKRFRKLALEGRDESTSEFSAITSEYGAQPSTSSTENQPDTQEESDRLKVKKDAKDVHEIPIL